MARTASGLLLLLLIAGVQMHTVTYFEQIPVEIVKKIVDTSVEPPAQDWRELAQRIQIDADPGKMIKDG
jgi:hypothetical protein